MTWRPTGLQSHFRPSNSPTLRTLWASSVSERPCGLMVWCLGVPWEAPVRIGSGSWLIKPEHSLFWLYWPPFFWRFYLPRCRRNGLRGCAKVSGLIPLFSGVWNFLGVLEQPYRDHGIMRCLHRANSLLVDKSFSLAVLKASISIE